MKHPSLPSPAAGELVPSRPVTGWLAGPSGAVTPGRLTNMLAALDAGACGEAMAFFDRMEEKDLHLGAVMQTRALAAVSAPRDVVAAGDDPLDREIADFARQAFGRIPRLQATLTALMSAVSHGFAVAEIIWEVVDGDVVAADLVPRPQRLFSFIDFDDPARLLAFPRYLDPENPRGMELPREKFVYHRTGKGDDVVRAGIYRGIAWAYLFSNYTVKDWVTFLDLYGVPLRLGTFKPGADDAARDALKRAVRDLGSDAAAVISDDTAIEFINAQLTGDHTLFRDAAEFFDRQKSKRILGQTLTTEAGSNGSRALGDVHDRVRRDIVASDAQALDETLSHDLIRPLIDYNFGPQRRYPKVVTRLEGDADRDAKLDRIERLVKMGATIPSRIAAEAAGVPVTGDAEAPLTFAGKGA